MSGYRSTIVVIVIVWLCNSQMPDVACGVISP
jgi:hypothetical protein